MDNGISRYYQIHDRTRKDSKGIIGVYAVMDRQTGEEVCWVDTFPLATDKINELEKLDKIARGIKVIDLIEIPFSRRDVTRPVTEVVAPTIHR